jgi:crotonyl-CoA carboxylase/reductase
MSNETTRSSTLMQTRVRDCMHLGVLTCSAHDSLKDVAAVMADHQVHAVVITTSNAERPVGVVSALDVVASVAAGADCAALEAAGTETLTVGADEPIRRAAQLMSEHGVSHLMVVDGAGGYPLGVVSTLDIATVYADS